MPYLGIFWLELKKIIVIFEMNALEFLYSQNFARKQKCLNLRPKMPYLGTCGLEFEKTVVVFGISALKFG